MNKTMKKTYKTPTMKVVEVQQRLLLSGSNPDRVGVFRNLEANDDEEAW